MGLEEGGEGPVELQGRLAGAHRAGVHDGTDRRVVRRDDIDDRRGEGVREPGEQPVDGAGEGMGVCIELREPGAKLEGLGEGGPLVSECEGTSGDRDMPSGAQTARRAYGGGHMDDGMVEAVGAGMEATDPVDSHTPRSRGCDPHVRRTGLPYGDDPRGGSRCGVHTRAVDGDPRRKGLQCGRTRLLDSEGKANLEVRQREVDGEGLAPARAQSVQQLRRARLVVKPNRRTRDEFVDKDVEGEDPHKCV